MAYPKLQSFRQTGNLLGADANANGPNYQANAIITPATLPGNNQEMYSVYWNTTVYGGAVPPASLSGCASAAAV